MQKGEKKNRSGPDEERFREGEKAGPAPVSPALSMMFDSWLTGERCRERRRGGAQSTDRGCSRPTVFTVLP